MLFCGIVLVLAAVLYTAVLRSFCGLVRQRRLIAKMPQKSEIVFGAKGRLLPIAAECSVLAAGLKKISAAYAGLDEKAPGLNIPDRFTDEQKAQIMARSAEALHKEITYSRIVLIVFALLLVMQIALIITDRSGYVTPEGVILGDRCVSPDKVKYRLADGGVLLWIGSAEQPVRVMTKDSDTCDMILGNYYETF